MTNDDPFERAAEREQEIRRERRLRALRLDSPLHDGSLVFLGLWAVLLAGHYLLFGFGVPFFIHASIFGLFVVMLTAPVLTGSALWAPILIAHVHHSGWTTLAKLDFLIFMMFFVLFASAGLSGRKWLRAKTQREAMI